MSALDEEDAFLVRRLATLAADIAALTEQAEEIKAELRKKPPGDYEVNGQPAVRILTSRRFDIYAAAASLPEAVRVHCLEQAYNPSAVKRHLTPEQLDAFMVESGKPRVSLL